VTGWDVFTCQPSVPPGMVTQLAELRAALPNYDVLVIRCAGQFRFEAIRRHADAGPWCVISADAGDLWRELAACVRPAGKAGAPAARAP